ncbi:hypothetical protein [Candidatus Odyssella thessalonicensis]|uniref:hypothetical protein n=1 Tax=Candidatus Odyssella thessalonicensis TaxID=84647 RepID=UPI000225AF35|nr:hypothetical protein [Candidatus Odyssella thessalonicensis]
MLYTLSNSGRGSENAVYIIESVLKFLKEKAALELAAEFNKQDNRNTNVLKDVLLCAYYATQCQNKKAYEHALNALRLGRFDNILTLLKASWINIEFREEFFRKAQPELEEMVKHYRITLIDPDILSFLSACFFSGTEFLPKSLIKGYEWYRYALQYGAQKAHHTLINILQINNRLTNIAGINVIDFYKHLIDMNYPACHIAQLHLARLYLEKVDGGKENYKLSFNYLTSSLAHEKIGTKRRQNYQWKNAIGQEVRYSFEHMERFLLVQLQDKRKPLYKRGQAAYNLACLHMWGGYQKEESIYKTLYYFGLALNMGITHSDFFLTVIRYHLTELLGHKEFRSPNPIRGWYRNALEKLITSHSEEIRATLKIPSPSQLTKRALKEMDPIFNTYCKEGLAYTGLLPALCYKYGIGGTTIDITRSIEWLRKTAPHDKFADFIFKKMYPAFQILQEKELIELNERRFDADSKLRICFIGGGITAIISALLVARLEGKNNNPLFDVHIFEKEPQLLDGASKLISRLHLGGEYPKDEKTARQCLLSAILIRQLFQTELFLTERKFIDFLLAEASPGTPREENHLTFDDLLEQYKNLQQDYQVYYQILEQEWHNQTGSKLFGLPEHFVNKLSPEQIEALGIGTCYNAGLHTPERGFQPVGMGILLEYLLGQYKNITIHRSSEISHIERIGEQGFRLEVSPQTSVPYTFYTQYLVNSAWASVPYINSLVKIGSEGDKMDKPKTTTIYLRSMALIDISRCELPEDRSFFGLIGEHGGMLSCFNSRVASLFIPGEDLSYQGEYTLNEDSPLTNNLPDEAREAFNMLSYDQKKKKKVAKAILANAVKKYPPLKEATVIDLITRTTLTRDAEIHQRQHDNVRWVDSELRCLEAYSPKGSFAIFTALQVIARLSEHRDIACHMKSLNKESRKFLKTINKGIDFEDKSFIRKIAKLPADFILVKEDTNLPSPLELVQLARKYEFYRNLPFTLFEEHTKGFKANMGIAEKFKAIEWGESIDLQHIDLTADLVETLIDQFKNGNIKHLKLGKITIDEQESDEGDESGEYNTRRKSTSNLITLTKNLLKKVSSITSLQSLSLNQWDLNHKNYIPSLRKLLAGLKSFTLSNGSLSEELVGGILSKDFKNSNLQSLTFSQLTDSSNAIHTVIGHIDLFPNIQEFSVFPDSLSLKDLEIMIKKQRSLKRLSLRGDLMSAESASASGKEIDKQLKGALNLLLAIANAKHLEYVDIRGNKKLHLCQKGLDYYFDITSAIESPLAAPPSSDYLQRITKAEKGKEKKE